MKKLLIMAILVCLLLFFLIIESDERMSKPISEPDDFEIEDVPLLEDEQSVEDDPVDHEDENEELDSNEQSLIGLLSSEVMERFGEPVRIDQAIYSYDWWIYPHDEKPTSYLQMGIQDDHVVTVFAAGDLIDSFYSFADTYEELDEYFSFSNQVEVKASKGQYQFQLSNEDLTSRPLVEVDGDWVQLYFDTFTGELSSIRVLDADTLVEMRPYSVSYIGVTPERPTVSNEVWQEVEKGEARQIFDYSNVIRARHGLEPYKWEEDVSVVAYEHSREMKEKEYFSHTSPEYGELDDRFDRKDIRFRLAGENIAAMYMDGLAAVEGWLNSEGHRVNLLHEEFTHLGVGVFQDYYTQNFMTPWANINE